MKNEESSAYLARVEAFWPGLVGWGPFTPSISRQEDWAGRMVPPPTVPTWDEGLNKMLAEELYVLC